MGVSLDGGADHHFRVARLHARDVLPDCSGEQFRALGKIADVRPKLGSRPFVDVAAVQAHHAAGTRPGSR